MAQRRVLYPSAAELAEPYVWAYDFVMARTHDGRAFRMPTIIDASNEPWRQWRRVSHSMHQGVPGNRCRPAPAIR